VVPVIGGLLIGDLRIPFSSLQKDRDNRADPKGQSNVKGDIPDEKE
jgi:hypothetical protein